MLEFERAATLRDQIQAIEKVHEGQKVLHLSSETLDLIALATDGDEAWMEVFFVRQGKLVGRDHFIMTSTNNDTPGEILSAFVKQFYEVNPYVPPRILVQDELVDTEAIETWLGEKRRSKVPYLRAASRREAASHADGGGECLGGHGASAECRWQPRRARSDGRWRNSRRRSTCRPCRDVWSATTYPTRRGRTPWAAWSSSRRASRSRPDYRKFQIKAVDGVDDYSMMREMLTRRFRRLADPKAQVAEIDENDDSESKGQAWQQAPDLVLIDGGKGHLGAALQVFLELGITSIPLASLAKENEELFVPQTPEPIVLPRTSPALFLVQRLRDEAHRFAITYHRQRRSKKSTTSALDHVPGIGAEEATDAYSAVRVGTGRPGGDGWRTWPPCLA